MEIKGSALPNQRSERLDHRKPVPKSGEQRAVTGVEQKRLRKKTELPQRQHDTQTRFLSQG
jgi:hypothetical protein